MEYLFRMRLTTPILKRRTLGSRGNARQERRKKPMNGSRSRERPRKIIKDNKIKSSESTWPRCKSSRGWRARKGKSSKLNSSACSKSNKKRRKECESKLRKLMPL